MSLNVTFIDDKNQALVYVINDPTFFDTYLLTQIESIVVFTDTFRYLAIFFFALLIVLFLIV